MAFLKIFPAFLLAVSFVFLCFAQTPCALGSQPSPPPKAEKTDEPADKAAPQNPEQTEAPALQRPAEVTPRGSLAHDLPIMPEQRNLSDQANETYAYLTFIQAIFDEDEAALLEAAPLLAKTQAPTGVWLDGGVWLMSRKSPNSVIYLENALKAVPEDISLNLLYAEALGDHGMAERGVQLMRDFLKKHPDSLDARIELALLLVKTKDFQEAQKILNSITSKQRTPLVDYYQAKALLGMDKSAEALPYLRKAVKGMPDFVDALAELAFIYEKEGNYKEARAAYEKLQKLHFSPQEVALRLVGLSLKLKQPERAAQYARQGPDTLPFKISAAHMFMEARHYLQAENILKQIAEKPDAPVEVYLLLADLVYEQRHNLNMALGWLDKISDKHSGAPKAAILRAQLLAEAGKPAEALEITDQALTRYPELSELADARIRILHKEGKLDQALAAAREASQKWPDDLGLVFLYGSLLDEAGNKAEAMTVMENLLKKQPDNFQALNYVGYTLAEENRDLERALELLKRANDIAPNQAFIIDSLAWAYYRLNLTEDALREIRRAISLGANVDATIWEHYGDIAARASHKDEAKRAYRKAIELKSINTESIRSKLTTL